MRFIERFTRDDVSAKVWWPFTMLLVVLLVLTFPGEHRAIDARHRETAATDAALSDLVIAPLIGQVPQQSITGITGSLDATLMKEISDRILANDARIEAVRIWSSEHRLLWASTASARLGSASALNDGDTVSTVASTGTPTWLTTDKAPDNSPTSTLYYAYSSIGTQPLVVQFDYHDSTLTSDIRFAWLGYQIALGLGVLLSLTLALLSMREPKARIGTGVSFYPESVPKHLAVIDADRAVSIEQAGDRIKERVSTLQHKLDESEEARRHAEGQLQQALAALNTPGHRMPVPVPEPIREAPQPALVQVPEPEPAVEAAARVEPVVESEPQPIVAAVPPIAPPRQEPAPKPEPRARPKPVAEPAPTPPVPEPVVAAPEPVVAAPEPVVAAPEPVVAAPEPEPVVAATTPQPVSAEQGAGTDSKGWPEVVIVPELQPAKSVPAPGQESAADMLDRLVEPVGAHDPTDEAGDLRARLARTAAIKKPGSKERREADEQQHRH
jgi:hypothetical protein